MLEARSQAGATLLRFKGVTVRLSSSSSSSSRSEGHAGGFDSPSPAPSSPRCSGGRGSGPAERSFSSRPRLRGAQTTIDLFLALTGFLSQLLLRQRGSLPVLAGSPERAGRVAAVMADVVFVAGGHSCIMVTPARPPARHPAGVPAVASSRSLFTKAFLFSSSSWLGMRPALPPSM